MVAKPLCPLYKNIIKPLDRARYPELRSTYKKIRPDAVNATSGRIFIVYSIKIPYVITPYRRLAGFVIRRQKRFDLLKPRDL